jgi:multicomponent Na+:H+ antiporter subunit C
VNVQFLFSNINYIGSSFLFVIGLYTVLTHPNLIKKIIGINIMETSVFLLFVSIGFIEGGRAPILLLDGSPARYVNPLPSALILTGIVVAVSITVYALSMIIKIYDAYGTIELDEIMQIRSEEAND